MNLNILINPNPNPHSAQRLPNPNPRATVCDITVYLKGHCSSIYMYDLVSTSWDICSTKD